ncbi:MAG: hypothetical protein IPF59_14045 [Ignavibacteria bacterium]|nr:hypothetical protein [Ignavibacteria bacterium]
MALVTCSADAISTPGQMVSRSIVSTVVAYAGTSTRSFTGTSILPGSAGVRVQNAN